MRTLYLLLATAILGSAACATDDSTEGPTFLAFGANKTAIVGGADHLVVTAALTDPDGIDDLVGGTLLRTESGAPIGAFATSAAEGAYSMDLGVQTLVGDATGSRKLGAVLSIGLTAQFFDQAGNTASKTLDVTAQCENDEVFSSSGCSQAFTARRLSSYANCVQVIANVDTDMTCGETCAVIGATAASSPSSPMRRGAQCYCGTCQ